MALPRPPDGLRHWRHDDADVLARAWTDAEIARWNAVPRDVATAAAEAWIAGASQRWERRSSLDLVVTAELAPDRERGRGDDAAIGEIGFSSFTTDPDRAEVGLWMVEDRRGRGAATRALAVVTAWALDPDCELGLIQLWARTDPANVAAEALFARAAWSRRGDSGGYSVWSVERSLLG